MENFDIFQIFLKKVKIWSPRIGQGNFDMRSFSKILSFLDSSLRAASFYAIPSLRGAKSLPAASFPQTLWYLAGAAPPRRGAASPLPRRAEIFFSGSVFSLGACFSVGCWVVLSGLADNRGAHWRSKFAPLLLGGKSPAQKVLPRRQDLEKWLQNLVKPPGHHREKCSKNA